MKAGLPEIMVVTGGPFAGDFLKLLGNGRNFGLNEVHYTYQEGRKLIDEDQKAGDEAAQILVVGRFLELVEQKVKPGSLNLGADPHSAF